MHEKTQKTKKEFNRFSIKAKLISVVVPIVIISILTLLFTTFIISQNIIVNYGNDIIQSTSESNANNIEAWVQEILSTFDEVKNTLESGNFTGRMERNYLVSTMNRDPSYPYGIYIGDDKGNFFDPGGWQPPADYVIAEREWYKEGITHDSMTFGATYLDAKTGDYIVSATSKFKTSTSATRVMAIDIYLTEVSNMISSMQLFETSYVFSR